MSSDASRSEDIVQDRPSRGVFVQICVKSDRDRAHVFNNGLKKPQQDEILIIC